MITADVLNALVDAINTRCAVRIHLRDGATHTGDAVQKFEFSTSGSYALIASATNLRAIPMDDIESVELNPK